MKRTVSSDRVFVSIDEGENGLASERFGHDSQGVLRA
jgi:hypothetical protein